MIALALAKCEIMPARQPREIACRNQSPPCDIFEITRKLRPEGGFERDLLAHRDDAEIGERCLHLGHAGRSEEHTSELQSLMRISYAVFCLKKKRLLPIIQTPHHIQQSTCTPH